MSLLADNAQLVVGTPESWNRASGLPVRKIFDSSVLEFLTNLSSSIFADAEAHKYPDVVAFALWCRQSALATQKASYADGNLYLGRGLVFHVSPTNVPLMFAYTLAVGLLSGNVNIVRLPSREFPQVEYLCRRIVALIGFQTHSAVSNYITCIRYDREKTDVTRLLSELCDVRVIWGGDTTVSEIRKAPLRPGAFDMVFPDRYSIAVIDSEAWLKCEDKKRYIRGFYNDTYLSDHSSCSSPRLVLWLGGRVEAARASFWGLLEKLVAERYQSAPARAVEKVEFAYYILARRPNSELWLDKLDVSRVWVDSLETDLLDEHPGGGVFLESSAHSVDALLPLLQRRCQTISYYGVPVHQLTSLLCEAGSRGGDRIVPMGHTLDFSLTWDGYDIIRTLSRKIDVVVAPADS